MNYYIEGDAAKAEQIKAEFEKLGCGPTGWKFNVNGVIYYTTDEKKIDIACSNFLINLIKTHPDYKELQLPVEPRFKEGDWLVYKDGGTFCGGLKTVQVQTVEKNMYIFTHGTKSAHRFIDSECRLWTPSDAEDGDILMTTTIRNCPFIYRKTSYNNDLAYYYAGVDGNGDFCEGCLKRTSYHFGPIENVVPATKKQRDLLFAKMKEAGYEWDEKKKELCKIIKPKFKVGDDIKTGNTIETIAEVDLTTRSYCCESGRTIWFENQDLWHLAPKPHYDIANFKPKQWVLVRDDDEWEWALTRFSHLSNGSASLFVCINGASFQQCIPFEGNEHLLGTTNMCDEQYINW